MAIDPKDNISKKVEALPIDKNRVPLPALIAAIVDGSNEIIGYLPLKVTDNGDGTATLVTSGGGGGGVDPVGLKNIALSPINPATEDTLATRASEATLATRASEVTVASIDTKVATEVTLATRASEATLATLATEATLTALNASIDVALSTRASEATLATRASESTLSSIDTKVATETTLGTRASEATLATRASEATLDTVKDNTGLDDKTKIYEQTITVATVYNVQADMDTKFSVTGSIVRSVTIRSNRTLTVELNADGEVFTVDANVPFTIDTFNVSTVELTPTMSSNIKIFATGFGGV